MGHNQRYIISAIVSTYNAERLIRGCLEDLEAQTIAHRLEIIVVDAASEENEQVIVKEFQGRYGNIRYYRSRTRETVYQAWNRAIRLACGKYITTANTDDRHRKDGLERLVKALEAHPEIPLAYGDCLVTETENERFEDCTPVGRLRMPDFTRNNLLTSCIVGPQPVWRRSLHDEIGFFDEKYRCGADYDFWLRISEKYNLIHIRDYLGLYLANKDGVSMKGDRPRKEMAAIQEAYLKRFSTMPHLQSGEADLFRIVHRLHMEKVEVNILISPQVSECLLQDLSTLPGLNIFRISENCRSRPWDLVMISLLDANNGLIHELMSGFRLRYIGIAGLAEVARLGEACAGIAKDLLQSGCTKVFSGGAVFEWKESIAFGTKLYQEGSVQEAMAFLGKSLASNPADINLLNTLTRIALEEGFVGEAEGFALKAARLDRRCIAALMNRVRICLAKKEYQKANELSRYILEVDRTKQPAVEELMGSHLISYASSRTPGRLTQQGRSMRILVINNLYPPQELGGYGKNIADFAYLLEQRGHETHVLTSDTHYFGEPAEDEPHVKRELQLCGAWDDGGQRLFEKEKINLFIRSNQETVRRTLSEFHPDICLAGNIDLLGVPVFEPLFEYQIPILHYLGNEFPAYNPPDYPGVPHYHVATASHWLKQDAIRRGYPLQDAYVIYPGAFVQSFEMPVPPDIDRLRIAYAGLVMDSKGPQVLVNALNILAKKGIDFVCFIAGGTINKRFLAGLTGVVQDLGLADKIRFTGQLDREGLKNLFAKSNVLVFPSLANETFGISQVEAMAAGLLVITSGPGGAREVIENGKNGLYFESGNPVHLADQLFALTTDRLRWEDIALAGRRRAMDLFDIERSVDKLETVLFQIVNESYEKVEQSSGQTDKSCVLDEELGETSDQTQEMRSVRMQLARLCLDIPLKHFQDSYQNNLGQWHRSLCCSELKTYCLTQEEEEFVSQEVQCLSRNLSEDVVLQHVLATILYLRPFQMPVTLDLDNVPSWFQMDYFRFLIEPPLGVLKPGDADGYYRHLKKLVQILAERIQANPDSNLWAKAAAHFVKSSLMTPLYFTQHPLRDIYISRGRILQYVLSLTGFDLDYHFPPRPPGGSRIRLGVHLENLRSVTEMRATLPIFEYLDRESFEVLLYVSKQSNNEQEKYCRDMVDRFVVMPQDVREWAKTIRSDDLDILVLGNNSTAGVNNPTILGAHRLARVQCVHFCSPVTTGLEHIDYFLLGSLVDPEGRAELKYSEKLLRVPGSGICFSMGSQSKVPPRRSKRRDFGMPENRPLFVSGANFYKITPELRALWALIIAGVPESVLALYPFGPAWSSRYPARQFTEEITAVFTRYGIAKKRLIILKPFESRDYIKSFLSIADVYLDATPYSGATSLLDPLEVGVPPVVTEGPELRFCQGAAMLKELGVPDLIAESEESYIRLAVRLGTDQDFRKCKSMEIRDRMAQGPPFLDPRSYGEKVGKVFKELVARDLM
ncbi:MAG: glycosyltransferase [Deltaproteobacteria bacterium]|nr:glycosyltransferase [Deltaproteobacteria bacterium]